MPRSRLFLLWLAASCLWMTVIFLKSAESYQQQDLRPLLSEKLSAYELSKWFPHWEFTYDGQRVTWQQPYDMLEFMIRKAAHVGTYAILTFLWVRVFLAWPFRLFHSLCLSMIISLLYAASDEWHQSFVPGRTGHGIDIAVDAIGILLTALLFVIIRLFIGLRNQSKN
jgi:VanZ family protein